MVQFSLFGRLRYSLGVMSFLYAVISSKCRWRAVATTTTGRQRIQATYTSNNSFTSTTTGLAFVPIISKRPASSSSSSSLLSSPFLPRKLPHEQQQQQHQKHQFFNRLIFLSSSNNEHNNNNDDDVEPTWKYVPYDPSTKKKRPMQQQQNQRRRQFSTWNVPKTIEIPEDQLEVSFVRSSGAGGQNVNKVNTKVELKLQVMEAKFIPLEVRERLFKDQSNRINKDGYLTITSQEYRTQGQNRKSAMEKLQQIILESWPRPKIRKQRKGPTKAAKERNKEYKKKRSEKKKSRGRVDF